MTQQKISDLVATVYDETAAEVDIFIFFVKSASDLERVDLENQHISEISGILASSLVGTVYTHDDFMTIWPNDADKRQIIKFGSE